MITFTKEVVVSRTFELSAEDFVKMHLREVRQYGSEIDLFVQDGKNSNFITSVITLKASELVDFEGSYLDFDIYARSPDDRKRHNAACEALIQSLEIKFKETNNETN